MNKDTQHKIAFVNRFMKESNAYGKYKANCIKSARWMNYDEPYLAVDTKEQIHAATNIEIVFEYLKLGQMLQYAFEWETTVEGRGFWARINENYLDSLRVYNGI